MKCRHCGRAYDDDFAGFLCPRCEKIWFDSWIDIADEMREVEE